MIKAALSDTDFQISVYDDGKAFLDDKSSLSSDLVFLDLMMPRMDGFQVMETLSKLESKPPIIVLSALSQRETVAKAIKFGVKSYMIKPLRPEGILRKATEILRMNF